MKTRLSGSISNLSWIQRLGLVWLSPFIPMSHLLDYLDLLPFKDIFRHVKYIDRFLKHIVDVFN